MIGRGRVQNGVVVLEEGVRLPDGQEVTVLTHLTTGAQPHSILEIPPVSPRSLRRSLTADDDLLEEMLEGR